jgi:rhamnosyltransferase
VRAVLDADTPLAPYAGMFWARPQALGALLEFEYEDFAVPEADAVDGDDPPALRDVVERLYCHAAHSAGFSVRTAVTPYWAAVDYTRLEYKTARVAAHLPGFTQDQIDYLDDLEDVARQARERVPDPPLVALKWDLYTRHPRLAQVLSPAYGAARTVLRRR